MLIVICDEPSGKSAIEVQEFELITQTARMFGCRIYIIPPNFDECGTAENALAYLPSFDTPISAVWVGFIPTVERYVAIHDAARQKNICLVNSPEEYRRAMEFDQFYPLLGNITPKSWIIEHETQLASHVEAYPFPVFVKGAIKSDKEAGWSAVVAANYDELTLITRRILARPIRSRGKVIIRELVKLKIVAHAPNGFPAGREFRVFLYNGEVLTYGFYWDIEDDPLTLTEEHNMLQLAQDAAHRINVPFIAVDIGQLENGSWIVIEVGDGQFCGLSNVSVMTLWSKLKDITPP